MEKQRSTVLHLRQHFLALLAGGLLAILGMTLVPGSAVPASLKLYIESDTTTFNKDRQQTFKTKTWLLGEKMRVEMIPQGGGPVVPPSGVPFTPPGGQMPTMVMDRAAKTVYMINYNNKSAMRIPLPPQQGFGPGASDPTQIEAMIRKNGGRLLGAEKVKSYQCDIWEAPLSGRGNPGGPAPPPATIKVWLSREWKIPVRSEIRIQGRGLVLSNNVSLVTRTFTPAPGLFQVPSGFKITDMTKRPPPPMGSPMVPPGGPPGMEPHHH